MAKKEGLDVEFIPEDMREFSRKNRFDAVINLFTSFGFFENQKDDYEVARNMHRSLKSGSVLLMDLIGKEILARNYRPRDWFEADGALLLEESKRHDDWSRISRKRTIIKSNVRKEENINLRLYATSELKSLLIECGLKRVDVYGNIAGDLYDHKATRLVVAVYK